ncbi:MAG: septal ring lytic transglycosylase RlpA family protein [Thermodesulfobacteriota bacterium]|nr:septal ring lytic transglycosylase RlpA family protein [Thermodesulfobacteriota bacterium]
MKRLVIAFLIPIFCLLACAKERQYVKLVPPVKTVVLPEKEKGKIPESYVVNGERYYPLPDAHGFVQFGKASWYGSKFHGRPTASGEIYNMHKKSAAHKTLPLGTPVKILNLSNNKHTIVRVNDRGPFTKGRIIDLSYAAAKEVGLIGPGVVDVKIVALGREIERLKSEKESKTLLESKDLQKGIFTIQVGAFQNRANAFELADRLRVIFDYVNVALYVNEDRNTFYRVHVSKSQTLTQAGAIEKKLEKMGFKEAFIVRI